MNIGKAILGSFLSFFFLTLFFYGLAGVLWAFNQSGDRLVANISVGVESAFEIPAAPEINAEAVISVETNLRGGKNILFEKNSDIQLPIASLTKLMTAVVVLDNYDLSSTVVIDKNADSQNPVKQDVKLGDIMSVENLLKVMLVGSSNKSAYALSEMLGEKNFVKLMNQKAKELGLDKTYFADPTGLSSDNVSTASDIVKMTEHILGAPNYYKIVEISGEKEVSVPGLGKITNTDRLLDEVPEAIFSKTGFTTAAKGCLLLVTSGSKDKSYIINIILGSDDRFSEMRKLINWSIPVTTKT